MMLDAFNLSLFIGATLVLLLTPGPAVLYIIARSIDQGRSAGLVAVLGMAVGSFFHILAAAFGLSALLMTSSLAFQAVKYVGAAYLIYLGVRKLISRSQLQEPELGKTKNLRSIFTESIVVNLLNPKTALFFLAFLPQFIHASQGSVAVQFITLGAIFTLMGLVSDSLFAILAASLRNWVVKNPFSQNAQHYFIGMVYILLGAATALTGSNKK